MTSTDESILCDPKELARLRERAYESERILSSLKSELEELTSLFIEKRNCELTKRLIHENAILRKEIEEHKDLLVKLETQNKVPQITRPPFPRESSSTICTSTGPAVVERPIEPKLDGKPSKSSKKEQTKKVSVEAVAKEETPVDFSRLDLRVGRIISAKKHPDADSLYVEEVDVGEDKTRTVVSGLVRFVPLEQMQNRLAVLLCNLKPAKMRGVTSEAMVMCASTPEKVEILDPPTGCQPGDHVYVEGYDRKPDPVLNPKHKVFETVAPDLKTDANKVATYRGIALHVPGKGKVMAQSLTCVQIK